MLRKSRVMWHHCGRHKTRSRSHSSGHARSPRRLGHAGKAWITLCTWPMDGLPKTKQGTSPRFHIAILGGVDLPTHYGLFVDCKNNSLLDGSRHCPRQATSCFNPQCHCRRQVTTQPSRGIPRADQTNRTASRGTAKNHAQNLQNTRPSSSVLPTLPFS